MTHGTRGQYQAGCSCLPCRAAEATYRTSLRARHRHGLPILGALISPVEARRRIRQLKGEGYPVTRLEAMRGHRRLPRVLVNMTLDPQRVRIRLATLLTIRRLAQHAMLEGVDLPPV